MFKKKKKELKLNHEEEFFMLIPDCRCSACLELYSSMKKNMEKERFNQLDYKRLYKFYYKEQHSY